MLLYSHFESQLAAFVSHFESHNRTAERAARYELPHLACFLQCCLACPTAASDYLRRSIIAYTLPVICAHLQLGNDTLLRHCAATRLSHRHGLQMSHLAIYLARLYYSHHAYDDL